MRTADPPRHIASDADLAPVVAGVMLLCSAAIGVVAIGVSLSAASSPARDLFVSGTSAALLYAAMLGASALVVRRGAMRAGVILALSSSLVAITVFAIASGLGINALLLGAFGIIVVVGGVVVGMSFAIAVALSCAAALVAMYAAETQGWLGWREQVWALPLHTRLLSHLLLLLLATLLAWVLARIVGATIGQAKAQEERFRALLHIAADWYWEQDEQFRFTQISGPVEEKTGISPDSHLGRTRWEIPELELSPAQWAAHRADLQAHRPFRDFVMRRLGSDGRPVYVRISGEPVFDAAGGFRGYWGVGRDVTQEVESQRALEVSETRYRDLFTRSPSPFIIHRAGIILVANEAAARLFGHESPLDMCGLDVLQLNHPDSREQSAQRIAALEDMPIGGSVPTVELRLRRADGHDVFAQASVVRIDLGDGPASLSIYFDVTERRRAELALRRSESMLSRLFEASPDAVMVSELDSGRLVLANERYATLFGYGREESIGRLAAELGIWTSLERRQRLVEQLRRDGVIRDVPLTMSTRDGGEISVLYSAALMRVDQNDYMVSTVRDVTRSEQERLQYEAILRSASVGIAFTRDSVFQHANESFEQMFGWPAGALAGQPGAVVWPSPEDYAQVGRLAGPLLSTGKPVDLERRMRRHDGSEFWCRLLGRVVDPTRPVEGGTIWIAEDVTERRRAEQALARSEAMLSRLFEASPDYITVSTVETGLMIMVNEGFSRMTGFSRDEALGRSAFDLGFWHDVEDRARLVAGVRSSGVVRNLPATLRRKDGRLFSALFSAATIDLDGEQFLVATARDVTDSEQSRLQYEAMFKTASVGIAFTRDQRFEHVNPRLAQMLGWTAVELTGKPGSIVWPSEADYADIGRKFGPALARGEGIDFEHRLRRRDGIELWARLRARGVDPRNPGSAGTIWIVEDITARREADAALAAARDAAESASRAKSAFLANTSHEIRTPLNGLLGLARLALEPRVNAEQQREYLQRIVDSAQALAGIISDILDLSKIEAGKLTLERLDFDLHALITSIHTAYRELAADKALTCTLDIGAGVPRRVSGDPVRVRQIATNFLANALKFTERGRIDLRLAPGAGGRVRLEVADTGIGIDPATRERLFTPFTQADDSTTRRFGGTGLGLSICRQLALLMGGEVGVNSEPGAGSTFWAELALPAATQAEEASDSLVPDEAALRGARVLLVEDNPVNLLIAETLLTNWGVEVVTAGDGRQAIEAVEREQGRFDAVLMDVHMPVMSGHDATVELRRNYSPTQLPIIALTAAALVSEQEQSLALGMNDFISKPFDAARLRSALARWTRRCTTVPRD